MSNIPSSGHYGFVTPVAKNIGVDTTSLPFSFWRKLLLFFLIAAFVFCMVWLVRIYTEINKNKVN